MVSLVWALKGRNISTWLCTVLHCSGYTVSYCTTTGFIVFYCIECISSLDASFSSLSHLDVSRVCDLEMKYEEVFIDGHLCLGSCFR